MGMVTKLACYCHIHGLQQRVADTMGMVTKLACYCHIHGLQQRVADTLGRVTKLACYMSHSWASAKSSRHWEGLQNWPATCHIHGLQQRVADTLGRVTKLACYMSHSWASAKSSRHTGKGYKTGLLCVTFMGFSKDIILHALLEGKIEVTQCLSSLLRTWSQK
ncbi:hypothetical protein ACJMK2_035952 [Sinanodonta woodiana]|uniref:Uncharacterized protein n=1 Tax=Sinanodonta woodiana TaxID=1069815 RepID=A0ABD3WHN6_SINWO